MKRLAKEEDKLRFWRPAAKGKIFLRERESLGLLLSTKMGKFLRNVTPRRWATGH